ncbi:hypothetical protein E9993_19360 [Labilibacter sediminis]|nr:hypothetical protein E9993_19360 [Labilibacter sediminis]
MKALVILLFMLLVPLGIYAQNDTIAQQEYPKSVQGITNFADWAMDLVTFERENYTFFFLPLMGYEERTGFEIGVMPVWRFYIGDKPEKEGYYRPSNISPSVVVSTNGMLEFDLSSDFYTQNAWYIQNKWVYRSMPDKFFGIGNSGDKNQVSDFEVSKFEFSGKVMKGVMDELFVGINYDAGNYEISNIEGSVLTPEIPGYDGGGYFGVGPVVNYDQRNSIVYPTSGNYVELSYTKYFEAVAAYEFSSIKLDVRKFIDLGNNDRVLAFQGYVHSTRGDVPFYRMAVLGGKKLFRGIAHPYKYIDNHSAYLQVAYRSHLWWRLGYEAFAGVGNVFNEWDESVVEDLHLMTGIGLRFRVLEKEKLNFRMDLGVTNKGDRGIFFTLGEAF